MDLPHLPDDERRILERIQDRLRVDHFGGPGDAAPGPPGPAASVRADLYQHYGIDSATIAAAARLALA